MARGAGKNNWALFLLVLAGIVIGSFIAQAKMCIRDSL